MSYLKRGLTVQAVITVCLGCKAALGADWRLDPRVELQGIYDDNYTLATKAIEKIDVRGAAIDGKLDIRADDPTLKLNLTPAVRSSFFPGERNMESTDEFLNFGLEKVGRTTTADVNGYYSRQTLLRDYLPTSAISAGLGQQEPVATPAALGKFKQSLFDVAPALTYQLTPRNGLLLNASYVDARYDQQAQAAGVATNYKNASTAIGWDTNVSPTGTLVLRGTAALFDPEIGSRSNTYGLQGEWDVKASEIRQYYFRLGANRTIFGQGALPAASNRASNGFLAGAGVNWTYQVTQVFLDLTRDVSASGQGVVVNQDLLRLRLERRFTQKLAGFFGARASKYSAVGDATESFVEQKYATGTVGFEWRLLQAFSLICAYDTTWRKYATDPSSAQSNEVTLSFVYEPHRPTAGPAISVGY